MSYTIIKWLLISAFFASIHDINVAAESSEMMAILESVNGSIASVLPQIARSIQNQEATQNNTMKILSQLVIVQAEMANTLNQVILMIQGANDCFSRPCQNQGNCVNEENGYRCECQGGWTGDHCEIDIDECAGVVCLNGGQCIDAVNAYTCQCLPGWTGEFCETNIDECANISCQYGGVCEDEVNQFTCQCLAGWAGDLCERNRTCEPDDFLCDDGKCISVDSLCDGFNNCENGTDEDNTTCATCPYKFLCSNGKCVDTENVCDGVNHCLDNSDEDLICVDAACQLDQFLCDYSRCIPNEWACDKFPDCDDGMDENEVTCLTCASKFLCSNGRCVNQDELCDGVNDCEDNSDEDDVCLESPSPSVEVLGKTSFMVQWNAFADVQLSLKRSRKLKQYVVTASPRGGGESHTIYTFVNLNSHFTRGAVTMTDLQPGTIYDIDVRATIDSEGQGEQTLNIGIPRLSATTHAIACLSDPCQNDGFCVEVFNNFTCQCVREYTGRFCEIEPVCESNEFLCYGSCISSVFMCDGFNDCDNGTDEVEETCATCPFRFFCSNGRCVDKDKLCDGTNNCRDNSDEDLICDISPPMWTVDGPTVTVQWNDFPKVTGTRRREITYFVITTTETGGEQSNETLFSIKNNTGTLNVGLGWAVTVTYGVILNTAGQGEQTFDLRIPPRNVTTPACDADLGMESGDIPDENINASTYLGSHQPHYARLTRQGYTYYWQASSHSQPWIQADIGYQTYVSGVATQGQYYQSYWVTSFKVSTFSNSTSNPEIFIPDADGSVKVFTGNTNYHSIKTTQFPEAVFARIVRITCLGRHGSYWSMRFEIYGCGQEDIVTNSD